MTSRLLRKINSNTTKRAWRCANVRRWPRDLPNGVAFPLYCVSSDEMQSFEFIDAAFDFVSFRRHRVHRQRRLGAADAANATHGGGGAAAADAGQSGRRL